MGDGEDNQLASPTARPAVANGALACAVVSWVVGIAAFVVLMRSTGSAISSFLGMAGFTFVLNTVAIVLGRRARGGLRERPRTGGTAWLRGSWAVLLGKIGYVGTAAFLFAAAAIDFTDTLR